MNERAIAEWLKLSNDTKRNIFNETAAQIGLPRASAVEKDWWVVRTLDAIFQTEIADHVVFKGGTSLSKSWSLIDRLSEDIDLALDRRFFKIERKDEEMSSSQVTKLREKSNKYVQQKLLQDLESIFIQQGLAVTLNILDKENPTKDPVGIEVFYQTVTDPDPYLPPRVLIEIGSRSLIEPNTPRPVNSFVGQVFSDRNFADQVIEIPTVNPERTFLEKIFLLHELFQKEFSEERHTRKSRHYYDLQRLMHSEFAEKAWGDQELYKTIVSHRKYLNKEKGIDYGRHAPEFISIIPSDEVLRSWEKDYNDMRESMFYGQSLSFSELMIQIKALNEKINQHKI
jgi:predicted nucleotidyltransferase component of viral defense system